MLKLQTTRQEKVLLITKFLAQNNPTPSAEHLPKLGCGTAVPSPATCYGGFMREGASRYLPTFNKISA